MSISPFPWFALYVKPRHEKHVSSALSRRGYDQFLPLYHRHTRSRTSELPLFPGYVFCRFDVQNRFPVVSVPGVLSVVGSGGAPSPVADHEIDRLEKVVESGMSREPWPHLTAGQRIVIHAGPLRGVEGILIGTRRSARLVVSVQLLQRSIAVDIDPGWIGTA